MDSIIKRLQDKNNRKKLCIIAILFQNRLFKKSPKRPFVEKIENEIFLLY